MQERGAARRDKAISPFRETRVKSATAVPVRSMTSAERPVALSLEARGNIHMGRENWVRERAQLQDVLDQLASGKIRLEDGHEEYIEGLARRIALLDEKLASTSPR